MRIGILGAGYMGETLARHFVAAGHEVFVGGRTPEKAARVGEKLGVPSGTLAEAAGFADTLLLAVLYQGLEHTLDASGAYEGAIAGKVLIDCTNPVEVEGFTVLSYPEGSVAQHLEHRTGARIVKAFNLAQVDVWRRVPTYAGGAPVVPIAGDAEAKRRAAELVAAVGGLPADVGGVVQAGYLEAVAAIVIRQLSGGADATTTFQLISADSAQGDPAPDAIVA
jgi:predicted dinucleotide-binding enzyme